MKLLKTFYLLSIIIVSIGCKGDQSQIQGTWKFVGDEGCNTNFLGLDLFIDPYAMYGHKIYISDSLIYSPYFKVGKLPFEQNYYVQGDSLVLNKVGRIHMTINDSVLTLEQDECSLTFERYPPYETIDKNSLSQIRLETRDDNGELIDSMSVNRSAKDEYLFRLAEAIELRHVNKVFDEGVTDTYEYKILLKQSDGNLYSITSYGKYETPFEVITLLRYLFTR